MNLQVLLSFPPRIIAGILSGEFTLWGGVVRNATNGQIVALLREGGGLASNANLAGGMLKGLLDASAGGWAPAAIGAVDLVANARSHYLIMQQLHGLTSLVGIVGGIGLLNLAATVVQTGIILKRINQLERAVEGLYDHISKEFNKNRQVKMQAAIYAADNALDMVNPENKKFQANLAIGKLFEARQHIWGEVDNLKGSTNHKVNNQLLQSNTLQAMQLDYLRCRCLLEIDETERAINQASSALEAYRETSRQLVHRHLGFRRAAFFHNAVLERDLIRYLAIEYWLRSDPNRLLEILLANRSDFWNSKVEKDNKIGGLEKAYKDGSADHPLINRLTYSELTIQNLQRFQGFLAEIETIHQLGISYADWKKQQEETLASAEINLEERDDYVLLVDKKWLAEQTGEPAA